MNLYNIVYNIVVHTSNLINICVEIELEAQEAEPVSLTCLLAKKFQRRRFFNESASQKQDLSGGLVFSHWDEMGKIPWMLCIKY